MIQTKEQGRYMSLFFFCPKENIINQKGEGTVMAKLHTTAKRTHSALFGIAMAVGLAMMVTLLLMAGMTSLVINGTIGENAVQPIIFFIRLAAILTGCILGTGLSKGRYLQVIGFSALGYLIILLGLGIVLYDRTIQNLWVGSLSVLLGGALACLIRIKPFGKRNSRTRYAR